MGDTGSVQLRILGVVELSVDGRVRALGPSARLLLAVLVAQRGRLVTLDALADALWGDSPPPTARSTLQTHLSKLRRTLGEEGSALVTRPPGYVLEVARADVDADRAEDAIGRARPLLASAPGEAVVALDAALGEWRGSPFAEFADTPWAQAEASRLEELRLVGLELHNEARIADGQTGTAVAELEGLVREHPLRERFVELLMVALQRSGRQGEALRAGQALRRHLRDELGLEPSATFCDLERSIVLADDSLLPEVPTPRERPSRRQGPPGPVTRLVGRSGDLGALSEATTRARLVTLTGPGGVGKSALALETAHRVGPGFADGVCFVELAAVHDPGAVVAAVAHALDVERRSERSLAESVTEVLGSRRMLIVLDNCEHVLAAVGELVGRLVRWCPEVCVLATSREPIGIPGESVRPVAPLGVPRRADGSLEELMSSPSVQVFVARAEDAAPAFEITQRSAPAIAELCIALDGLPLALELAAARMASMSPRQLADRLNERFALLDAGPGREARHRTLLDLVEWSHELLADKERMLLARLSVFAGGFDLDAAEAVCGSGGLVPAEVAHLLGVLVDKSMVVARLTESGVRYTQLETLRQFGAARLLGQVDAADVHRAHVRFFVDVAEAGAEGLDGVEEGPWGDRLETEVGNLRVALHTAAASGDHDSALRLVAATSEWAFRRIRYEVVDWAETVVAMVGGDDHRLLPTALAVVGYGSFVRGELDRAVVLAESAAELGDRLDVPSCGLPERVLGNALFYLGDHEAAVTWIERLTAVADRIGSDARIAHARYMRSVALTSVGDPMGGRDLAVAATEAAERSGSPTAAAQAAYATGLAAASFDVEAAIGALDRSAELAATVGNRWMSAFAMTEAMWLRAGRGETTAALVGYRQVVETWFQGGDWANQWLSLRHLAGIFAEIGRDEEAALLFGAVDSAGASAALPFSPADADLLDSVARRLTTRLGSSAAAEARRRGAMMRDEATVAAALQTIAELT